MWTFFENYDVTKKKLLDVGTYSTVRKRTKRKEKQLMETTNSMNKYFFNKWLDFMGFKKIKEANTSKLTRTETN